jgi:hypothetical protein
MRDNLKDWQCPPFEWPDSKKLGWVKQAIDDGTTWVQDQTSQTDIQMGIDILNGKSGSTLSGQWSSLTSGDLPRAFDEIIETLANIRLSFAGYQTHNSAFTEHADMMNKVAQVIYLKYFVDRSLRDALQFGGLTGMGAISPGYSRGMFGMGKGAFTFDALSQLDVLPVQLPKNRDYQRAYVVTTARMQGVAEAHALFPAFQDKLRPFAKEKYLKGGQTGRSEYRASRWALHSMSKDIEQYTDIFATYVLDLRINDKPWGENDKLLPLPMGQPGTSWFYTVPFVGQEITRWEGGRSVTRPAEVEDCRVYPRRRLMLSCDGALMYDGPGFNWHGQVPLIPFYLRDRPWDGTGTSLFTSTAELQYAIDDLLRSMYRIAMARVNMSKSYNTDITTGDKGAKLTSKQAEGIDPFACNETFGVDGDLKEPVMKPIMPEWCYSIPEQEFKTLETLQQSINRSLGLDQIQALQKLRANIQSPEKLLEAEGPVVIGTSRAMERGLRELGEMTKYNVLQYMPTGVVIQHVGVDQIPQMVFDYDAASLVPSHLPGEPDTKDDIVDGVAVNTPVPSAFDQTERARTFADNLEYIVVPHSLHEIAQNRERLNILALMGKGPDVFPVDPETLGNKFDIQWGTLDGSTIKEKYVSFLREKLIAQGELKKLAEAEGLVPPPGMEGEGKKPQGRPQTAKQNPKAKQKGIGNATPGRAVISTSG